MRIGMAVAAVLVSCGPHGVICEDVTETIGTACGGYRLEYCAAYSGRDRPPKLADLQVTDLGGGIVERWDCASPSCDDVLPAAAAYCLERQVALYE